MSEFAPINPQRPVVETEIKSRLNRSRWFARVMFAVGLAAGSFAGSGGKNNAAQAYSGFGVASAAAVAAPLERKRARRTIDTHIADYAEQAGANHTGFRETVLSIKDGELHEKSQPDRTILPVFTDLITTASIGTGMIGGFILTRSLSGEVLKGAEHGLEVGGSLFLGMSALLFSVEGMSSREEWRISEKRLDNIDSGLRFEQ